jgi:hypothetical protein
MPLKDRDEYNAYMRDYKRRQREMRDALVILNSNTPTTIIPKIETSIIVKSGSLNHFLEYILKQFKGLIFVGFRSFVNLVSYSKWKGYYNNWRGDDGNDCV